MNKSNPFFNLKHPNNTTNNQKLSENNMTEKTGRITISGIEFEMFTIDEYNEISIPMKVFICIQKGNKDLIPFYRIVYNNGKNVWIQYYQLWENSLICLNQHICERIRMKTSRLLYSDTFHNFE